MIALISKEERIETVKNLIGKEMTFSDFDNEMENIGYYSISDDGVTGQIKVDGNAVYTAKETSECEVQVFFTITFDGGEDESANSFILKVEEVEEF